MKKELPGHIKKAFKSVDHFLPVVDVIVELVDARMPNGSRIKDFVKRLGKTSVIALAKSDLAPSEFRIRTWSFARSLNDQASSGCLLNSVLKSSRAD